MQIFDNRRKNRNRRKTIIFTGDVHGHLQSKMTRVTFTKLETQVQGGTALKQLPGNGRLVRMATPFVSLTWAIVSRIYVLLVPPWCRRDC